MCLVGTVSVELNLSGTGPVSGALGGMKFRIPAESAGMTRIFEDPTHWDRPN